MATKEAVFKLRVDTGNSVADINAADKAIQGFNKDLQTTKTIQADSTGSDNFAAKLAAIDQKVKAGGLGIRELSRVIREYQSVAIAAGEESVVGREAINQAGALKDRIGDLQSQTKVASSDFKNLDIAIAGIGTGAAVFQGLSGAIALTGIENEALTKTMVKLQAVQGIANAVNQVALALNNDAVLGIQLRIAIEKIKNFVMGDSAKAATQAAVGEGVLSGANTAVGTSSLFAAGALKAFKIALVTTGIGALVVGLGFLVSKMMDATAAQKLNNKVRQEALTSIAKELSAADKLKKQINDENTTRAEKTKIVKDFQKQYPSILSNVNAEKNSIQEINSALELNIGLLRLQAKAKAISSLREEEFKKQIIAQTSTVEEQMSTFDKFADGGFLGFFMDTEYDETGIGGKNRKKAIDQTNTQISALDELDIANTNEMNQLIKKGAVIKEEIGKVKTIKNNQHEREIKINDEAEKLEAEREAARLKSADVILDKLSRETSAIESAEDLKIAMMVDGKAKQESILLETYGDFREDLVKKANKNEIDALDEKLKLGTLTEQQYRDELQAIMENGSKNFSDAERNLDELTFAKFVDDKRRLRLTAQELEIDDINKAFNQKDITEVQRLEKIQEINDKYAKIDRDKAAKNETEKRNTAKFLNDIMLNETENALANIEFEDIDAKARLLELLNSTNANEKITQKQHDDALIKLEEEKQKKIKGIKEKGAESDKAIAKQKFEEDNKQLNDIIEGAQKALDFANEINSVINQAADQKIQETNNRRDQELASLDAQQEQELAVVGLTAEQKTAIEEKFAIAKYNVQKKAFDIEDKLNRQKFNREKAMKMTSIVISTAEAVMKSIAANGGVPAGVPFGIASGVLGAAQLAVVASSKYQGGSAPSMPSLSGGGGSTGASGEQFAPTTSTQAQTETAGLLNGSNTPTTGQVFVLESDISQVQNNVMVAEAKSKF